MPCILILSPSLLSLSPPPPTQWLFKDISHCVRPSMGLGSPPLVSLYTYCVQARAKKGLGLLRVGCSLTWDPVSILKAREN